MGIRVGNVVGEVKRAKADVAASTVDAVVIPAVSGRALRVLALSVRCGGTATIATFNRKPSGAGVAISGRFQNGVNGGAVLNLNELGWFETPVGEGLTVTTQAGSETNVDVVYAEV